MISDALVAIFCTLIIGAGWYYLSRSTAVDGLEAFESPRRNKTRRATRRLGAWSMIVLSFSFFWMIIELKRDRSPARMALSFAFVIFALMTMILTVLIDVYLTYRIRQSGRGPRDGA